MKTWGGAGRGECERNEVKSMMDWYSFLLQSVCWLCPLLSSYAHTNTNTPYVHLSFRVLLLRLVVLEASSFAGPARLLLLGRRLLAQLLHYCGFVEVWMWMKRVRRGKRRRGNERGGMSSPPPSTHPPTHTPTKRQGLRVDARLTQVHQDGQRLPVQARVEDGGDLVHGCVGGSG